MKKNEKILIAVLVLITAIVIIFAVTRKGKNNSDMPSNVGTNLTDGEVENLQEEIVEQYVAVDEDGTKVNTSEALKSNKVVNNVEFSDIQLSQKNGETLLTATVKNTGTAASDLFSVNVTLVDDAGQDIVTVGGLVAPMQAGGTSTFETSMTLDYANAYDFRVELDAQ